MKQDIKEIAIIGGGMMGLVTALELAKTERFTVTLFEKREELGGLSASYEWEDCVWDRFYHVILSTDKGVLSLIDELDLTKELFFTETKSGFYKDDRLVSFSTARDFISFPFLSYLGKLRLGIGIIFTNMFGNVDKLDHIYVRTWLIRLFGKRVYEQIWDPLLRSKLGAARTRTSAAFIWATIRRLYGARSGAEKVEKMGHVHGGYKRILKEINKRLLENGVEIRTSEKVKSIIPDGPDVFKVETEKCSYTFNRVVCTVPNPEVLSILPCDRYEEYWKNVGMVEYLGIVCMFVVLERTLSPYYVINLLDTTLPFTGIIEATNVVKPEELSGKYLIYLPRYVSSEDPVRNWSDTEVKEKFINGLMKVFPDLHSSQITHTAIFRETYVQPLQDINYIKRRVGFHSPINGLFIVNNSMILNSTLNNNVVIRLARDAAETVLGDIREN